MTVTEKIEKMTEKATDKLKDVAEKASNAGKSSDSSEPGTVAKVFAALTGLLSMPMILGALAGLGIIILTAVGSWLGLGIVGTSVSLLGAGLVLSIGTSLILGENPLNAIGA